MKKLRDTLEYDNISEKIPNWIVKATSETIKK